MAWSSPNLSENRSLQIYRYLEYLSTWIWRNVFMITSVQWLFHFVLVHTDGACQAGWPIKNRGGPDSPGWTMVSPDQRFLCNGQVTEWRYQAKASHGFRAIVWRPVDKSATKFRIVGINNIPAGAVNTPVTYSVPAHQRIRVQIGDLIGWSFGAGVLTYNGGGGDRVRWLGGNLHGSLKANQERDINTGVQDREYSIAATVGEAGESLLCLMHKVVFLCSFSWHCSKLSLPKSGEKDCLRPPELVGTLTDLRNWDVLGNLGWERAFILKV